MTTSMSFAPGARAASTFGRGGFGAPVRYPQAPGQEKAYQGLVSQLTSIKVGPYGTAPFVVGPFNVFPENVAEQFSAGIIDGTVAAMKSEPAQDAIKGAVMPYVLGALAVGLLGGALGGYALYRQRKLGG